MQRVDDDRAFTRHLSGSDSNLYDTRVLDLARDVGLDAAAGLWREQRQVTDLHRAPAGTAIDTVGTSASAAR